MMSRMSILGAVVVSLLCATNVAAQDPPSAEPAPEQAAPPTDMQGMMQGMMERMQGMHEMMQGMQQMMQSMHGGGGMQGMHGGGGMQGMQGQQGQQQPQTCIMRDPEGGLSALLLGSVADLGLSDAQRQELDQILARAQGEALAALTAEQRARLEAAPVLPRAVCPQAQARAGGPGGP
jgi:hypothetical protein